MIVNKLPAKTWNRLNMNNGNIDVDNIEKICNPEVDINDNINGVVFSRSNKDIKLNTNMGEEFDNMISSRIEEYEDIFIADDMVNEDPVIITYNYENNNRYINRLNIHVGADSKQKIIVVYEGEDKAVGAAIHQIKVESGIGSDIEIYTIQLLSDTFDVFHDFGVYCNEESSVKLTQVELGASNVYTGAYADLVGKKSYFESQVGYFASGKQKLDMNYVAHHVGRKTESIMNAVGVIKDNAQKVYRGTIDFVHGSVDAKGSEKEDVLLLSEDVVNQSIPLILCGEENVEGNHGATIGRLDQEVLFYLGCHGISEEEAEKMIAKARIQAICKEIPSEDIFNKINSFMEAEYARL